MVNYETSREKFISLSAISTGIREAITGKFGDSLLWIVAEISELNVRKGHCYLSLVEKLPGNAAPVCELKGIVWANKFEKIITVFRNATGVDLAANTRILFQASVRYDVKWGLSLVIEDIEPKYTIGLLQQERDRTVAKLKEEGVYLNNKNLTFPLVPTRVAAISAKDSRGYEDFVNKLETNIYGYNFKVTLFSSLLQGDKASVQMVDRLIEIYNHRDEFDVVVIVRGGGGAIDLNCFNDYRLSRAVARFPLPVLTGIGHTTNISVVDEVAHADRITPTDAADFIVEKTREFETMIENLGGRIHEAYLDTTISEMNRLQHAADRIKVQTSYRLQNEIHNLSTTTMNLKSLSLNLIKNSNSNLTFKATELGLHIKKFVAAEGQCLNQYTKTLSISPLNTLRNATSLLEQSESSVRMLDPVNVLKRGFSITQINGKAILKATSLKAGDRIKTTFYEGTIESEVTGN